MNVRRVVIRSLLFYWKTGLVVAFGVAIATAVITGSLVVGDSVTGSVRRVALARLGDIDHALVSPHLFPEGLVAKVAGHPALRGRVGSLVPAIIREGAVANAESGAHVPRVNVLGVDRGFWSLYPGSEAPASAGRRVAVNGVLARDLDLRPGDDLLLTVGRRGTIASNTLFGRRERDDTVVTLRLTVAAVLEDGGAGAFSLDAGTGTPRNLFVSRAWLARGLRRDGFVNAILVASADGATGGNDGPLRAALQSACTLAEHRLKRVPNLQLGYLSLESEALVLSDRQVEAVRGAAADLGGTAARTSVYLADTVRRRRRPDKAAAYAIFAGVEPLDPFKAKHGRLAELDDGILYLNTWAEDDLGAHIGDSLEVLYRVPARDGSYVTRTLVRTLQATVDLAGPALDPGLVPDFEGITNADTISEWDPPFPIDQARVTKRDDEYWTGYRATPKAFVSLNTMRRIWTEGAGGGWVTSVRAAPPLYRLFRPLRGTPLYPLLESSYLAAFDKLLVPRVLERLSPQDAALAFRPVRREAVAAASGSTDFAGLFLAMSFFLVASGAGLAGMLMRLSVERRAAEMGALLAGGFQSARAGRLLFAEGAVLALVGAAAGVPLGVRYAHGIIGALRTWWLGAVGTSALWVHVTPAALAVGFVAGLVAGLVAVWWGVRRVRGRPVLELLSGWQAIGVQPPGRRSRRVVAAVGVSALGLAAALIALSLGWGLVEPVVAFFGSGTALLIAGLASCAALLMRALARRGRARSMSGLALRSAAAHRGRSLLAVGLLACASLVIVAVAANQRDVARADVHDKASGTGGFALRALSSLPVHYDLGSKAGRAKLGFPEQDEAAWQGVKVVSFLMASGEDISCLNLARPTQPRVLGVPRQLVERGGFRLATSAGAGDGWAALASDERRVIADAESAKWQLHRGLGDRIALLDESGTECEFRFAGLIASSVLAGELLISDPNFRAMFPSETAPRYFLIETPPGAERAVADSLRRALGATGLEVRGTGEILNELIGVQNTYLMTFLALGGLGLLLGSVGLVVVLLRNALERRREFALMLATGFGRPYLAGLLVLENVGLLLAGLACGTVAALIAVAPQLASVESAVNWTALIALIAGIIGVGVASSAAAAAATVRGNLIEALRSE